MGPVPAITEVVGLLRLCCDHPLTPLTAQKVLNEDTRMGAWTLLDPLSTYWSAARKPSAAGTACPQHWVVWQLEEKGWGLMQQGALGAWVLLTL